MQERCVHGLDWAKKEDIKNKVEGPEGDIRFENILYLLYIIVDVA